MANKKKYEDAKMAAWYADPKALDVLDALRTKETQKGQKEISRSSYLNDLLIKVGLEKGVIKPEPSNMPDMATIIEEVTKSVVQALKNEGRGLQTRTAKASS